MPEEEASPKPATKDGTLAAELLKSKGLVSTMDDLEDDVERSGSMIRRAHALAKAVYENSGGGCKFFLLSSVLVAVLVSLVILIEKTKQ